MDDLTHLDEHGAARMVDVGAKPVTERRAIAEAVVILSDGARTALLEGTLPKGDATAVARIAAIQGAKRTADLIPLCHPLPLTAIGVDVAAAPEGVRITVTVATTSQTGVEMEAMTGASIGALAVYDMVKGIDRGASIGPVRLLQKSGGVSGDWSR